MNGKEYNFLWFYADKVKPFDNIHDSIINHFSIRIMFPQHLFHCLIDAKLLCPGDYFFFIITDINKLCSSLNLQAAVVFAVVHGMIYADGHVGIEADVANF